MRVAGPAARAGAVPRLKIRAHDLMQAPGGVNANQDNGKNQALTYMR